jgi:hypothetical protein
MDLALYGRVLWRFRWLVLGGVILAVLLATLSTARVSSNGLRWRKPAVWGSSTTLLLTQGGFPWGRVNPGTDPARFGSLTDLYAQLANSDAVRAIMRSEGAPKTSWLVAGALPPTNIYGVSPLLTLSGRGPSGAEAVTAVRLGTKAFLDYVVRQQSAASIPPDQRVDIEVIQAASPPILVQGHKKTLPIVVLLAVLSATVALAFMLENLRPRPRPLAVAAPSAAMSSAAAENHPTA